ncbi:MAG: outer membrane beta-barrel protein, partial [Verrucomicrobiota bacterium]
MSPGQLRETEEVPLPERERMEEAIAEPVAPPAEAPLKLTGYVDGTYFYNFGPGSATASLDFPADTTPKGDFNLSALWLRLEKPLVRESQEVHAGFQFGVMLGEDATWYAANPNNLPAGPDSNALYVGEAFGKIWVPDAQMELWFGKFQAVIGY